jgi:hypothetical protein
MAKKSSPKNDAPKRRQPYSIEPWEYTHTPNYAEITAYVEASGKREVVAKIMPTSGFSAEFMAGYLCQLVNDHNTNHSLLVAAKEALELCLADDEQSFSSEQAADAVITRINQKLV